MDVHEITTPEELAASGLVIRIVSDDYGTCPECGAYWGHPDPNLDWPNRQKVDDWWKCYNPACKVQYFHPASQSVRVERIPETQKVQY